MNNPVLLLNGNYNFLSVVSLKRAVSLILKDKVHILSFEDERILHPNLSFGMPSVICLKYMVKAPYRQLQLSKNNILERDNYTCQYCSTHLSRHNTTIDHVIPKSRKDSPGNTWKNLVACCLNCNNYKGGYTPEEAGMRLIRQPFQPTAKTYLARFEKISKWEPFLK